MKLLARNRRHGKPYMQSAQLRPERYKPVGNVDIELYAWLRPVVGVAIGVGLRSFGLPNDTTATRSARPLWPALAF